MNNSELLKRIDDLEKEMKNLKDSFDIRINAAVNLIEDLFEQVNNLNVSKGIIIMKKFNEIVIIFNVETNEFFFTTDHCQETTNEWVPVTYYLPINVKERKELPTGIVKTKEDLVNIFCSDLEEIKNPNKILQG